MINAIIKRRFGAVAIQKGYVTKDQFVEGIAMQVENELEGIEPMLIGSVLNSMGYMENEQVRDVIESMMKPEAPECPICGIRMLNCSNCGTLLR